jgi:hypothetical protein
MAKIRHLYRKVAIYGILLAAGFVIAIWLYISGVSPITILLLFGAALVVLAVAYLMFEPLALYIFRAKISN